MHLTLPFPEAVELALQGAPLPPPAQAVSCTGDRVRLQVDLRAVPDAPFALRAVAALSPVVTVEATFVGFDAGSATFALTVHAGSIGVHRLLNHLTGTLNAALRSRNLPPGLVVVRRGAQADPVAVIDLRAAVALAAAGVTVTGFALADATVVVDATLAGVELPRPPAPPAT